MAPNGCFACALSAILLALAFQFPWHLGWLALFFFVPLVWCVAQGFCFSWRYGLLWGILFWPIHTFGVLRFCYAYWTGRGHFLIYPFFLFVLLVYTCFWFGGTQVVLGRVKSRLLRSVVWALCSWCYFVWMHTLSFSWIGQWCGYPFALPIVPLAAYGPLLCGVAWVGMYGFLALVLSISVLLAHAPMKGGFFVVSVLATLSLLMNNTHSIDERAFLAHVGFVAPMKRQGMTSLDLAQTIDSAIARLREHFPAVTTILMPESAFPFALNECLPAQKLWMENSLSDDQVRLILGAYACHAQITYNCLFSLQKSRIIFYYVKNFLMPFTEVLPACCHLPIVRSLFATPQENIFDRVRFGRAKGTSACALTERVMVQPCLCSELFFDRVPKGGPLPILCLVNDSWFACSSLCTCMKLYAKLSACALHRAIIYVGHYDAFYFSVFGDEQQIVHA